MLGALLGDLAGSAFLGEKSLGFSPASLRSAALAEILLGSGLSSPKSLRDSALEAPALFCPLAAASACFWLCPSTPEAILASEREAFRASEPSEAARAAEAAGRIAALLAALHGGIDPLAVAADCGIPTPDPASPPSLDPSSPEGSLETVGRALRSIAPARYFEEGIGLALSAAGDPLSNARAAGAFLELRFFPSEATLSEAIGALRGPAGQSLGETLLRVCRSPSSIARDRFPGERSAFAEALARALSERRVSRKPS